MLQAMEAKTTIQMCEIFNLQHSSLSNYYFVNVQLQVVFGLVQNVYFMQFYRSSKYFDASPILMFDVPSLSAFWHPENPPTLMLDGQIVHWSI